MALPKASYLKESTTSDAHADRPRDEEGKPKLGTHYLKRQNVAPRFVKTAPVEELSVNDADVENVTATGKAGPIVEGSNLPEGDPNAEPDTLTNVTTEIPENPASA